MTANILTALILTVPSDSPFRTLYNILFFGLPRVGNLLPYTASKFSVFKHLTWDKIELCHDGIIINLQVTKTIQNFERVLRIPISGYNKRKEYCVVSGLNKMKSLKDYPMKPKDPVFNVYDEGKWAPMTKKRFGNFLKAHLEYLGIDLRLITPSSFRKGGLSHMLLREGNMELLRLQGDWISDSYKRYLVIPAEQRFSVTSKALQNMPM